MHIGLPTPGAALTLALTGTAASGPQWQAGQTLNATVIEAQRDGTLLLQLEGQGKPVQARSPLPLAVGQQVKLMVAVETNRIVLRLLQTPAPEPALQQAWRTALPRQLPLAAALQYIARLATPAAPAPGGSAPLPAGGNPATSMPPAAALPLPLPDARPAAPPSSPLPTPAAASATTPAAAPPGAAPAAEKLLTAATEMLNRLAEPQRLTTADGLRQAALNSGLFLEARLARGDTTALRDDFRAGLLRLLGAVREQAALPATAGAPRGGSAPVPALPVSLLLELSQQIEGALARVKVQQLHSLSSQSGPDPAWLLELPLRHGTQTDVLRLRIQREGGGSNGGGAPGWSARLHFDTPEHGGVDSVVTLLGGKVGVSFWAEQPQTAERFRLRLEELRDQLQHAGLEVEHLRSTLGRTTADDDPAPSGLVDMSV